jgi:hypothetical protein
LESGKLIHVGQRIHCILNGGTDGVVTAIHGRDRVKRSQVASE